MDGTPDRAAPPRRRGTVVWPLLLIAVGSLLLLQNLGLLPWSLWGQIWRLWPAADRRARAGRRPPGEHGLRRPGRGRARAVLLDPGRPRRPALRAERPTRLRP